MLHFWFSGWFSKCETSPTGAFFLGVAALATFAAWMEFCQRPRVLDTWDDESLRRALRSAPPDSTIRILETWIPNCPDFCDFLEALLTKEGKQFRLEILLVDPGKPGTRVDDLLAARVLARREGRGHAYRAVAATTSHLTAMKGRVDEDWKQRHQGARLDLRIRCYRFMPLGPIWQVGHDYLFVGFYLSSVSSLYGPMLVVRNSSSAIWRTFERDFHLGWQHGHEVATGGD